MTKLVLLRVFTLPFFSWLKWIYNHLKALPLTMMLSRQSPWASYRWQLWAIVNHHWPSRLNISRFHPVSGAFCHFLCPLWEWCCQTALAFTGSFSGSENLRRATLVAPKLSGLFLFGILWPFVARWRTRVSHVCPCRLFWSGFCALNSWLVLQLTIRHHDTMVVTARTNGWS